MPLDLRCSCVLVVLEGENVCFGNLSRKDVKAKVLIAQKMRKLEDFLKSYSMDSSHEVDINQVEAMIVQHEIRLAKKYLDDNKLLRMASLFELFEKAKDAIKTAPRKGNKRIGLPPFSLVSSPPLIHIFLPSIDLSIESHNPSFACASSPPSSSW